MPTTLEPQLFDQIEEGLKDVIDPELGVNIVDLGLIYDLAWDDENDALIISMTLTSAGCPLTDVIEEQMGQALDGIVERFRINWIWMPPWGPEKITDDGRDMMRAIGFSISATAVELAHRKVARRSLARLPRYDDLARATSRELLDIHGVGQKAVGICVRSGIAGTGSRRRALTASRPCATVDSRRTRPGEQCRGDDALMMPPRMNG